MRTRGEVRRGMNRLMMLYHGGGVASRGRLPVAHNGMDRLYQRRRTCFRNDGNINIANARFCGGSSRSSCTSWHVFGAARTTRAWHGKSILARGERRRANLPFCTARQADRRRIFISIFVRARDRFSYVRSGEMRRIAAAAEGCHKAKGAYPVSNAVTLQHNHRLAACIRVINRRKPHFLRCRCCGRERQCTPAFCSRRFDI